MKSTQRSEEEYYKELNLAFIEEARTFLRVTSVDESELEVDGRCKGRISIVQFFFP
jgi:hypothetical protein